ncbi:alpha/beta hydrolase [Robiginitomaculum antarcticum]|uniref:alpha/beta hydrolase n=1 Tax=Robiginitomaculum antarcticum TaxID=437507 RepID=UPI0003A4CB88|nr:alpha/beta hydrolase [Robiginitomaculum antarcticum]
MKVNVIRPEMLEGEKAPAIVIYHGGGWRYGSPDWMTDVATALSNRGAVTIAVEYRLSLDDVTPVQAFNDVCESLKWVRKNAKNLHIDPGKIAAYGVSAGGHLSASTATVGCAETVAPPDLFVLYSPAINTAKDGWFLRLMGSPSDPSAYSPLQNVKGNIAPTLIISGMSDTLTPHKYAVEYCEKLKSFNTECRIEAFQDVGHLLTRNLDNQESDFDVAEADKIRARHTIYDFLYEYGYLKRVE